MESRDSDCALKRRTMSWRLRLCLLSTAFKKNLNDVADESQMTLLTRFRYFIQSNVASYSNAREIQKVKLCIYVRI